MEHLPDKNSQYNDVVYWDERYKTEQSYDWLGSFSKLQHLLEKVIKKDDSILMLGCGNSSLSGDMYDAGYHNITNIDYSSVCIETMSARYSRCTSMTWQTMDVRELSFCDASFDVIIEKATLDAIMVDEKTPWEVSEETANFIHQALTESWRSPSSSEQHGLTQMHKSRLLFVHKCALCVNVGGLLRAFL
ncbi:Endothelin-converting enzyme 2 [Oryzias melastigma]|uniref:Endothelin-converting enzyme 2 n=1 Tax=Oryzias melastigma TaxID=30732 RepID=A0A834CA12_ORYME|nr:Endothelin-converting enzyme 2 [Oryzias melastigma]